MPFVNDDEDEVIGEAGFGGYDRAFNLSDKGYGGRVKSLLADNQEGGGDPVFVSATGKVNNGTFGDLTKAVRYSDSRGYGVDNGPDGGLAQWINGGDALQFEVPGELTKAAFTVTTRRADASLALDVDGDTINNDLGGRRNFEDDALVRFDGLTNGQTVEIDFFAESLLIDGAAESVDDGFWQAFDDAGRDRITFGTPLGERGGYAIDDLVITYDEPDFWA